MRHNGEQVRHAITERTAKTKGVKSAPTGGTGRGDAGYRALIDQKMDEMMAKYMAAAKKRRKKSR